MLRKKKYEFDLVFTSVLKRANQTTKIILNEMHLKPKVKKSWRLNERHYGALQGLNKAQMAKEYGEEQVYIWRRNYDIRPPALKANDPRHPRFSQLYQDVPRKLLPSVECLKDTVARVMPYWKEEIVPAIKAGHKILISAHGNSLRALVKYFDKIADKEIPELNIPTGIPCVYELDAKLKPIRHYYLADKAALNKAIAKVKAQGKVQKK
jgi:2,3-bisphosphoglycerate-dependent phosphoglycerate mutase